MDNAWLVLGSGLRKPAPPSPSRAEQAALQVGSTQPWQQTRSSQIKQLLWHWDTEQTILLGIVCPDTGQLHN